MESKAVLSDGRRTFRYRLRGPLTIAAAAILLVFGTWLCLAIRKARNEALACRSQCPLNQLQLALQNYHDMYRCFPPAYIADTNGTPIHSWRVLILPFIEQQSLYDAYRFDERWNGPNNILLADRMPQIFHVPSEPASATLTNIVAIAGTGTAFPDARCTRLEDFTDGLDNTILLAEIATSRIRWTEPRDLRVEDMSFQVNSRQKPSISCSRRLGPYVVFADSIHAYRVGTSLHPAALRALTTIAGGETTYLAEYADTGLTSPASGPATDEKIRQLNLHGLCALWLNRSEVTDESLKLLATAPRLYRLNLRGTRTTDDGVTKLREALPSCQITRWP